MEKDNENTTNIDSEKKVKENGLIVKFKQIKENKKDKKEKKEKKPKKHKVLRLFIKLFILLAIIVFVIGAGVFVGIFFSDKWAVTKEDLILSKINTTIYDIDSNVIATVSGDEKRKIATIEEIPQDLKDAFISIEDQTFEKHHGINFKRTFGAIITYVFNKGESSYGGSTITQQLIKNLMKDNDRSGVAGIQRKIREMSRAYQVERILSKDQILELYMNVIFMGGDVYGVELGSEYYFNKPISELSLAECAFLAGINHSPNNYNPFDGTDRTENINKRTKVVLGKMKELGRITQEEYDEAIEEVNEGLEFEKGNTSSANTMSYLAKAALNQVVKQYAEEKGVTEDFAKTRIYGGGFKIYTTQDSDIQSIMEDVYTDDNYIISSKGEQAQSAMVIIDHKTGRVVGMMGGLGEDVDSNGLNRAVQSTRQPGSSMKPIASIAPGLEYGIINAATVYDDSPTSFGKYRPKNSGNSYHGLITIRKAIEVSANVVEVKVMSELTPARSIDFLREKMGITSLVKASENSEKNDEGLGMVLGGLTNGISPLEMAGAYATIANNGVYITPTMYTKVEDSKGDVVLEPKQEKIRAMSTENAFIEKSILTGPVTGSGGTAKGCVISGFDVGAKTGTTNDNTDRWLCGFTEYYTGATWYGYDEPKTISSGYTNPASKIWAAIMKKIHSELDDAEFEKPEGVVSAQICLDSGKVATDSCSRTYREYFVKGKVPSTCDGHKHVSICTESGLLANDYCPDVEERGSVTIPEKESGASWKTDGGDKYDVPTETCDIHKEPEKKKVKMPNVIGMKSADASKKLKELGLVVTVITKESKDSNDKVIAQSKNAGTELKEGDAVTITISKMQQSSDPPKNTVNTNTVAPQNNIVQNAVNSTN